MKPTAVILRPFVLIGGVLAACAVHSHLHPKVQAPPANAVIKTVEVNDAEGEQQAESETEEVASTDSDEGDKQVKKHRPNFLGRIMKAISPAELTSDERVAVEQIVVFLKKYGPFSYASVEPFVQGATNDPMAIEAEIQMIKLEMQQTSKSENILSVNDYKEIAQHRIEKRVREGLMSGLTKLGVDPSTINNKDTVTGGDKVTDSELVQFEQSMLTLETFSKRAAPYGEKIVFRHGYYVSSAEHTLNGKITVPPEGTIIGAEEH